MSYSPVGKIKVSLRPCGILTPHGHQLGQMCVSVRKLVGSKEATPSHLGGYISSSFMQLLIANLCPYILPLKKSPCSFSLAFCYYLSSDHSLIVMPQPQTTILKGRVRQMHKWITVQSNLCGNIQEETIDTNKIGLGAGDRI